MAHDKQENGEITFIADYASDGKGVFLAKYVYDVVAEKSIEKEHVRYPEDFFDTVTSYRISLYINDDENKELLKPLLNDLLAYYNTLK